MGYVFVNNLDIDVYFKHKKLMMVIKVGVNVSMFILLNISIPWINFEQLNILGVQANHLYFMIILFAIFVINWIVKPMIIWFTKRRYITVLSYLISSSIALIIAYSILYSTNYFDVNVIKYVLYAIILLGIYLAIIVTFNMFKKEV